jgi:hypothetical protein
MNHLQHSIILEECWSEGAFCWVHKGMYTPNPDISGDLSLHKSTMSHRNNKNILKVLHYIFHQE